MIDTESNEARLASRHGRAREWLESIGSDPS